MEFIAAILRGVHVAMLVSLFGTLMFLTIVAPPAVREGPEDAPRLWRSLLRLARFSAVLALIIGVAWLATETTVIVGADGVRMTLHALPVVALRTQFGEWLLLRLALVLVVLLILGSRYVSAVIGALLAAAALAIQPMLGHAGAIGGSVGATLIISEIIHLLAAGAWLGGLLPLFISIGQVPPGTAATGAATSRRLASQPCYCWVGQRSSRLRYSWAAWPACLARVTARLHWQSSLCSLCC
jgi:copper resistance protein D